MKEGMKRFFSEKEKDKLFLTSIKTSCSHLTFSTEGLSSLVCVGFNLGRKQPLKKKSPLVKLYGFYLRGKRLQTFVGVRNPTKDALHLKAHDGHLASLHFQV